jgi:hypothetical protein
VLCGTRRRGQCPPVRFYLNDVWRKSSRVQATYRNAITIALGIRAVLSGIAGWWAIINHRGLFPAVNALAVFMMALWCCIGFVWLRDRGNAGRRVLDSAWGLIIDISFFNFDLTGEIYCQVSI